VTKLKNLSLNSIKNYLIEYRKKISKKYILIEFGSNYILIALASYTSDGIKITNVKSVKLPNDAIEKGIPSDSELMANLIRSMMEEEKVYSIRTSIIISPDSSYISLIDVPDELKNKEVIKYLSDPTSSLQIPIVLSNTDFDVHKTSITFTSKENTLFRKYLLVSIPKASTEVIMEICKQANLNLHSIESSFSSILRLIDSYIQDLKENEYIILLELLPECTHIIIADRSGPLDVKRIASIREYSTNYSDMENSTSQENEEKVDKYLPITKFDTKVVVKEIINISKSFFKSLNKDSVYTCSVFITGINSAHNNLVDVLGKSLRMPTYLISPINNNLISSVDYEINDLNENQLSRIIGNGIGLIDPLNNDFHHLIGINSLNIFESYIPNDSYKFKTKKLSTKTIPKYDKSQINKTKTSKYEFDNNLRNDYDQISSNYEKAIKTNISNINISIQPEGSYNKNSIDFNSETNLIGEKNTLDLSDNLDPLSEPSKSVPEIFTDFDQPSEKDKKNNIKNESNSIKSNFYSIKDTDDAEINKNKDIKEIIDKNKTTNSGLMITNKLVSNQGSDNLSSKSVVKDSILENSLDDVISTKKLDSDVDKQKDDVNKIELEEDQFKLDTDFLDKNE
tara:strand:- start:7739 stop:9613 length:1875 start_codon:yes stop_codon:yes gene_type:complete